MTAGTADPNVAARAPFAAASSWAPPFLSSLQARIGWLGVVIAIAITALSLLFIDAGVQTRTALGWVSHSEQIILKIDETMDDLREAESGQRGFLLTHDGNYSATFDNSITEAGRNATALVKLTSGHPVLEARTAALQQLVAEKITSLQVPLSLGRAGRFREATALVASGRGRLLMDAVARQADRIGQEERDILAVRLDRAERQSAWNRTLPLIGGPLLIALMVLSKVFIIVGVRRPVRSMLTSMRAFAAGDRGARVTDRMSTSEFRALASAYNDLADRLADADMLQSASEAQLHRSSLALKARSEVIELLGGMSHRMQTARTDAELAAVIRRFVPRVLPGLPGALYAHNNSRNLLVRLADWGVLERAQESFAPDGCWGLRRGKSHFVAAPGMEVICTHVLAEEAVYHCEPLLAGGEVIGLLYLEGIVEAESQFRLSVLTESIASALLNHRLQRGLREQTIRDPLTGLFNRRYMEEALTTAIAEAARGSIGLSVAMCDVDHFKRFNDEFGHDAGDALLRAVARVMRHHFRDDDIVCRYGGEEFVIIAPSIDPALFAARVEDLRVAISEIAMRHEDRPLGAVSMSFGIASWVDAMDRDGSTLIQLADAALYGAKRAGRDRVVIAQQSVRVALPRSDAARPAAIPPHVGGPQRKPRRLAPSRTTVAPDARPPSP